MLRQLTLEISLTFQFDSEETKQHSIIQSVCELINEKYDEDSLDVGLVDYASHIAYSESIENESQDDTYNDS